MSLVGLVTLVSGMVSNFLTRFPAPSRAAPKTEPIPILSKTLSPARCAGERSRPSSRPKRFSESTGLALTNCSVQDSWLAMLVSQTSTTAPLTASAPKRLAKAALPATLVILPALSTVLPAIIKLRTPLMPIPSLPTPTMPTPKSVRSRIKPPQRVLGITCPLNFQSEANSYSGASSCC